MRLDLLDYELPEERIARHPLPRREDGRLLVLGAEQHRDAWIRDLPSLVPSGALVVVNDTRVLHARLRGRKVPSGGRVELLLLRRIAELGSGRERWRALARGLSPFRAGTRLEFGGRIEAVLEEQVRDGVVVVSLVPAEGDLAHALAACGELPLPPYLKRAPERSDEERYQTVFARVPGAVAAPTAGLHLTESIISELGRAGVRFASVTLHVGLGTFEPVKVEDLDDHPMHEETVHIDEATVRAVAEARERGAPVVAIGTTVVRALETASLADRPGQIAPFDGDTRLLIQPGYEFRVVDALLTNFHLPRSTLLALVAAFAGRERTLSAYRTAVERGYRFYSYGDAMWISRGQT